MTDPISLMLLLGMLIALGAIYLVTRRTRRSPGLLHADHLSRPDFCPRCHSPLQGGSCLVCDWPAIPSSATTAGIASVRRHIAHLAQAGLLPRESCDRLLHAVMEEETRCAVRGAVDPAQSIVEAVLVDEAQQPPQPFMPLAAPEHRATSPVPPPPLQQYDVAARARRYEQSLHELPEAEPTATRAPRAPLANLLLTFMEEKNVRWGELAGGLLIVGCSVALVISFWSEIASRPFVKFGLLNGVVASLFGVGFYMARQWKLPTTSRGVLVIATLLVPLHFLAIAAFASDAAASDARAIAGEVLSVALFGTLVFFAGRLIVAPAPAALALGVVGSSAAQLLMRHLLAMDGPLGSLYLLAGLPLALHATAVGALVARLWPRSQLSESEFHTLMRMLGLTAFAAATAQGLLLTLAGNVAGALEQLSPLVALAGTPALASGLFVWQRMRNPELAAARTAGTAVAVLGGVIMVAALAFAWPQPALIAAVALVDFVVLSAVAVLFDIAAAHLLAWPALAIGWLVVLQVVLGRLGWWDNSPATTARALLDATSGNGLVVVASLYAAGAIIWHRLRRLGDAATYGALAAISSVASLALVTALGFGVPRDPYQTVWVYAFYATAALAAGVVLSIRSASSHSASIPVPAALAWTGSALVALAVVQGVVFRLASPSPLAAPWTTAAAVHGLVAMAIAEVLRRFRLGDIRMYGGVERSALLTSGVAVALIIGDLVGWPIHRVENSACAANLSLVALVWLGAAILRRSSALFTAFQTALVAAAILQWWFPAGQLSIAMVCIALAIWSCRRRFLYIASALFVLAFSIWFSQSAYWASMPPGDERYFAYFYANLIVLALPVLAWLVIETRRIRPHREGLGWSIALPAHRPATWLAVLLLALATALGISSDAPGDGLPTGQPLGYAAFVATALAAIACLWDQRAREAVAVVYLFGLVLVGKFLDALDLEGDQLLWTGAIALGAFTLATSYLSSRRGALEALGQRLGVPARGNSSPPSLNWFDSITAALVGLVLALVYWIQLTCPDPLLRTTAGQAAMVQALTLGLLAAGSRRGLQYASLLVGALGTIAFSWSWVDPAAENAVLVRSVATCVALVAVSVLYAIGFSKLPLRKNEWTRAAEQFAPVLVAGLAVSLVAVLAQEAAFYLARGSVPLTWPGILVVAIALLVLFAAALAAALLPGRDALGLSQRGRAAYIYAAEVVLALEFLHVRLTMPWLFSGLLQAYWPLVVMAIAYLGAGLSEWFRRHQQDLIAEPLERTGTLLPLLPVAGFWFVASETNYSLVLLVVGGLYTALAVTRRSFGFALLAVLAANGGLWHYLHRVGGYGLFEHPQLWLIPPALCVLAAAYLNRDRLSEAQMTAVRYLTSMTIYVASTADIFIQGVGRAPWLVLVLAALSVLGVFAGILLRVRAFLFLGTAFLVLSLVTLIWHAAVDLDQAWLWPASGIALGVAIIILFAVFEKKRQELLRLVDELKQWQP